VSSSRSSAAATSRQLHPSSNNTSALARRVTREAANPSRANAISFARSSSPRKPPRIIRLSESVQPRKARKFPRILNESGYIRHPFAFFILRMLPSSCLVRAPALSTPPTSSGALSPQSRSASSTFWTLCFLRSGELAKRRSIGQGCPSPAA